MHEGSVLTVAEDLTREAQKIWNALRVMVDKEIDTRTASCVRSRKMTVMAAPNGNTIGVAEPFGETVYIPYSSALANAKVGDSVWVDWKFNNASTMVAMATGEGQIVPDYMEINESNRNLLEARKFIQSGLTNDGDLETPTADTVPMDYAGIGSSNYYIHVKPSTNYRLTLFDTRIETESASCVVAQYASNGTFISLAASGIGWRDPQGMTFVTNVNAAFLRLSLVGFPKYRWKLEEGEVSTDWQPAPEDASPYTFDSVPTTNSKNPVTSDGIFNALQAKQNALTFDPSPTSGSTNPVTSGGIYSALTYKVDKAGDTMTGVLKVPNPEVYDSNYPQIAFKASSSASNDGTFYFDRASGQRRFVFRQSAVAGGYTDIFVLPVTTNTTQDQVIDIITGKGGSVYGDFTVRNGFTFNAVSPIMDVTSAPASGAWTQDGLRIMDKNHNGVGFFWAFQYTNGNAGIQLLAGRPINGNYVFNGVAFEISPTGEMNVGVSAPKKWREALNGVSVVTRGGTKVLGPFSSPATAETVITSAEINALIGVSDSSPNNTSVFMSNGDEITWNGTITCAYNNSVDAWRAQFSPACSGYVRVNWLVAYYG